MLFDGLSGDYVFAGFCVFREEKGRRSVSGKRNVFEIEETRLRSAKDETARLFLCRLCVY